MLLAPLLLLFAVCLLIPPGVAPRFDAIRTAPAGAENAGAAAALTFAAVVALVWNARSSQHCWTRDTLTAGVLIPAGSYLLLRVIADLAGAVSHTGFGFVLLLAGGAVAIFSGWRAATHPDIDASVMCLVRRQAGLAMAGIGLALIAHAADLPAAEAFALGATLLSAICGSVAGVLAVLAVHMIDESTGSRQLSRLGGLIHPMPATSAALAAALLSLSALPPSLGFAVLWLLLQSILSAPRTGGLMFQLPLALAAAALALTAALATAGSIRLIGIAVLGRPRTPQGAGARESKSWSRTILLVAAGLSAVLGILPGPALWLLANPAIEVLTGAPPGAGIGLTLLVPSASNPGYVALPVLVLLVLTAGAAMLPPRWLRTEGKTAGLWAGGMQPPVGLPFGDPAAQSTGDGFLPALPDLKLPRAPRLPAFAAFRPLSAATGIWLVLTAFGLLLLGLVVVG